MEEGGESGGLLEETLPLLLTEGECRVHPREGVRKFGAFVVCADITLEWRRPVRRSSRRCEVKA